MKGTVFLGDTRERLRELPQAIRNDRGYQLENIQHGLQPDDFKPMPVIGPGVEELRVRGEDGAYRMIYTARIANAIYVLHVFKKKTQTTSPRDLEIAKRRFASLKGVQS